MAAERTLSHVLFEGVEKILEVTGWNASVYPYHQAKGASVEFSSTHGICTISFKSWRDQVKQRERVQTLTGTRLITT